MSRTQMQEPTVLILTALADGPKHGYALISEADELSDGRVRLRVGTLYAALDRLGREGLVEPSGEEVVDGRLRRFYTLTGEGRAALEAEVERMQHLARQAAARLRHSPLARSLA
jgi:PadR family transcriptional regulator, regulatory protein PadR